MIWVHVPAAIIISLSALRELVFGSGLASLEAGQAVSEPSVLRMQKRVVRIARVDLLWGVLIIFCGPDREELNRTEVRVFKGMRHPLA